MRLRFILAGVLAVSCASGVTAADRSWENPVFLTTEEAVAAAQNNISRLDDNSPAALRFFVDLTLAEGDAGGAHPSSAITRNVVERVLVTHSSAFLNDDAQRRTIERFRKEVPRQRAILDARLARFGYPEMPGLVYCRLVDSVDAFAGLARRSSDKMSQIGGVTYYCRYVVLPLSYVGQQNLSELRRSAVFNPSLDVAGTIRRWERDSYANLIDTFRHEMVHVHTNTALDVPAYSDRTAYPTWFREGTATYLAADPHAGLSEGYKEFQKLFFYLAQRHGMSKLQAYYREVLGGKDALAALADVYAIVDSEKLFRRSGRWHRVKDVVQTGLWIAALVIVMAAFRGTDLPHIGILQLLAGVAIVLAILTGLAEHLYGLRGTGIVGMVKVGLALAATVMCGMGLRRIWRHRTDPASAS
ncbi:MAG: hypothetical protein GY906_31495 [bacterium]|nr:hypothetical protein [bacterium]